MALQAQKMSAAIHPALPMRDRLHMKTRTPGATPNETRSASEANFAPKHVSAPRKRAAPTPLAKLDASNDAPPICRGVVRADRVVRAGMRWRRAGGGRDVLGLDPGLVVGGIEEPVGRIGPRENLGVDRHRVVVPVEDGYDSG